MSAETENILQMLVE